LRDRGILDEDNNYVSGLVDLGSGGPVNMNDVARTGTMNGKKVYQMKDGSVVDEQGNPVEDK
jgi:hypothetical protein